MKYRYSGITPVTCYGVTFNPGDIKEVPGVIHIKNFVQVFEDTSKQVKLKPSPKLTQKRSVGRPPKKSEPNIISNDASNDVVSEQNTTIDKSEKEKDNG